MVRKLAKNFRNRLEAAESRLDIGSQQLEAGCRDGDFTKLSFGVANAVEGAVETFTSFPLAHIDTLRGLSRPRRR